MSTFVYALPDVGEGLDQAEIMSWKIAVGDSVVPDQVLAEVETDKSMVEVPSPVAGVITRLGGDLGDFIEVGATFVEIDLEMSTSGADASSAAAGAPAAASAPVSARRRVLASPATRRFAVDSGVDLHSVSATGPQGRVTKADVKAYLSGRVPNAAPGEEAASDGAPRQTTSASPTTSATLSMPITVDESVPFRGLRRTIAKNMVESWQSIPHITDFREIDATGLVRAREDLNAQLTAMGRTEKVTFLPFLIRAVAIALRQRKEFNASLDLENEQIVYHGRRNIGLAVSTAAGLFVPVVRDADSKLLLELARESTALAQKARDRSITGPEMAEGTFTITNFGSYGGWLGTPIIRPPEVAIAGFGRIDDKVVAIDGKPEVRKVLPLAVSADHRVIDGADMGAFLQVLTQVLENPVLLMAGDL